MKYVHLLSSFSHLLISSLSSLLVVMTMVVVVAPLLPSSSVYGREIARGISSSDTQMVNSVHADLPRNRPFTGQDKLQVEETVSEFFPSTEKVHHHHHHPDPNPEHQPRFPYLEEQLPVSSHTHHQDFLKTQVADLIIESVADINSEHVAELSQKPLSGVRQGTVVGVYNKAFTSLRKEILEDLGRETVVEPIPYIKKLGKDVPHHVQLYQIEQTHKSEVISASEPYEKAGIPSRPGAVGSASEDVWMLPEEADPAVGGSAPGGPDSGWISRRYVVDGTMSDSSRWINHLCAAQCNAFCDHDMYACQGICRSDNTAQRVWITMCPTFQRELSLDQLERNYQNDTFHCPGTCSLLRNQNDVAFIPMTPQVVLVRDVSEHSMTLTWSRPSTLEPVVFVVQEREESGPQHLRHWTEAHLVKGGDHFKRLNLTVCSTPTYRVAAVSRFGAYWFSKEVTSPAIMPGSPTMFRATGTRFDDGQFYITVAWRTPRGFYLSELRSDEPFTFQPQVRCGGRVTPSVFVDSTEYTNSENSLSFHVVQEVVNCEVILMLTANSACDQRLQSDIAYLTLNFSCPVIRDFYRGPLCAPSNEYIPPMNVENMHVTVLPSGQHGVRAHVTWSAPQDLGSEGRVDYYVVFYGFVHPIFRWGFNNNVYGNITVPGDIFQADIAVPTPTDQADLGRFGILVMPGVNGHDIDNIIGIMHVVPRSTFSNGTLLLEDEDLVVHHTDGSPDWVEVFWTLPNPQDLTKRDPTGVALMWGRVSKDDVSVHVTSDVSNSGNATNRAGVPEKAVGKLLETNVVILNEARAKRPRG